MSPYLSVEYEHLNQYFSLSFKSLKTVGDGSAVVECLTRDRRAAGSSLTGVTRVATVREKVLENEKFSRSGKVRELHFQSGKFKKKLKKVMEKSGNFKIFLKRC